MRLFNQFSDYIIFQQNEEFEFRGFVKGKKISALLSNLTKGIEINPISVEIANHEFVIKFSPLKGSFDDYELTLTGDNETIKVSNIHFGDVILFAGQSNMSYSLAALEKAEIYQNKCDKNKIYGLNLLEEDDKHVAYEITRPVHPKKETCERFKWEKIDSSNSKYVSGLSIMTSALLAEKVNYPVGFIHTAMGGLAIEAYYPKSIIEKDKYMVKMLKYLGAYYEKDKEFNTKGARNFAQLGGVFNEKISPLKGMHFKAFVWYLGESSCYDFNRAKFYKKSLEYLILYYRKFFNQESLPVLLTGIADDFYPYRDFLGYEYVNEVQANMQGKNIFYIPIHDIESRWLDDSNEDIYFHPIHPRNKELIAKRYVDVIYNNYIDRTKYFFPYIFKVTSKKDKLILKLTSVNDFKEGQEFVGFTIAGEDNIYYPAHAIVTGNKEITLTSKYVNAPKFLTYAFTQYTYLCNAKDCKNLPLLPYRSKQEDSKNGCYLTNQVILSCDNLSIRESTFGYELGGGFFTNIFDQSDIFHNQVDIKLDKKNKTEGSASVQISASPDKKNSYYYFAVNMKVGLSGAKHNFDRFKYLLLDLKASKDVEFHGLLFRVNGAIYKLPVVNKNGEIVQFVNLSKNFDTIAIDLTKYLDGSESVYNFDKKLIANISNVDIYFRSKILTKVNIDNVVCTNSLSSISEHKVDTKKQENEDNSIVVMKN